jgi:hypothetical protein
MCDLWSVSFSTPVIIHPLSPTLKKAQRGFFFDSLLAALRARTTE